MSNIEHNTDRGVSQRAPHSGLSVLLVLIGLALLGVNGWLAYQTWTLNQTLTAFVAQRSAPPAFADGALAAGGFPGAEIPGQGAGAATRQSGQPGATAIEADASQRPDAATAEASDAALANAGDRPGAADDNAPAPDAAVAISDTAVAAGAGNRGPRTGSQDAPGQGSAGSRPSGQAEASAAPTSVGIPETSTGDEVMVDTETGTVSGAPDAAPIDTLRDEAAPSSTSKIAALVQASIPVVTGVKGARVWDDAGALLMVYDSGATLTATGRSSNGDWLIVESETGPGWVQTDHLIAYGVQQLAVATLSPSTALAPMLDTAATPATTSLATPTTPLVTADAAIDFPVSPTPAVLTETNASPVVTATVSITDARLNVRSGPGIAYPIIAKADPGAVYVVTGRDGAWLQVRIDAEGYGDSAGWVDAAFVQVSGAVDALPVPVAPPILTPTPASTSSLEPAAAGSAEVEARRAAASSLELQGTIAFQQSRGDLIYVYFPATGELRPLTHGVDPAVNPDGGTVAFTRDGGETGIYLIDSDGANERRIFARPSLSSPKWSPDGQWILFSRYDNYIECYDIGRNECLLPDVFFDRFPFADPDRFPLVKEYLHRLAAVDRNGQNYHDIPALDSAQAPDWAEGGIVYQSKAGLQRTQDGQDITTQTMAFDNLNPYYFDPDWQPGGDQIVFQLKGAAQTDLWVVNADGSNRHPLTAPKTVLVDQLPSNVAPAYSPDGAHIAFLSNRDERNAAGAWRLWVMDADGGNQAPLPIDLPIEYKFGLEQAVSWGG